MSSESYGKLSRRTLLAGVVTTEIVSLQSGRASAQDTDCLFYEFTDGQIRNILADWGDELARERVRVLEDIESGPAETNYVYSTPDGDFYDNGRRADVSDAFTSDIIYIYHESGKDEKYFTRGGEIDCERVPFERETATPESTTTTEATPATTGTPRSDERATRTTASDDVSATTVRDTSERKTARRATESTVSQSEATESTVSKSESSDEFVSKLPTGGLPTEVIAAGLSAVAVLVVQRITSGDN
ncbi:hypothetical protein [Halorussus caseinilyticus]|uniref:PGF-CTERM sorting domain-containing protein n=1 Tax=Halorussus caseinilyticus TaxID=3034025 RepID=A0ABD5WIM1_9EURY|nr:hypothetical protein [Halorussus sp. DT72]